MNKLLLISLLSTLALKSSNAAVVTVRAQPVTITAASSNQGYASAAPTAGSYGYNCSGRYRYNGSNCNSNPNTAPTTSNTDSTVAIPAPAPAPAQDTSSSSSTPAPASVPGSTTSSTTPSSSNGALVSKDEFMAAFNSAKPYFSDPNVPNPTDDQFNAFINNAGPAGGITSRTELAMFLAEILWESGGLVYRAEVACQENNCASSYQDAVGLPGKYYYGRGYIQLTWGANYKAASTDLYGDDRLLQNPDQVATNEQYAWAVSFWFWKTNVKPKLNGTYNFGLATSAINGAIECQGSNQDVARKRYQIYVQLLKVFEPTATPSETGCYN